MLREPTRWILFGFLAASLGMASYLLGEEKPPVFAGLTVHEWGTFTSVAGNQGQAVEWSPLAGSTDLPQFVEHFRTPQFKLGLRGTVRMETPVLYFYDSQETRVSVKVSFAKGLITEWYPQASRVEPIAEPVADPAAWSIFQGNVDGSITWDAVTVTPSLRAEFQRETERSHYYAARMTSATPVVVRTPSGEQQEKFLFYRGVSRFSLPLTATLTADGSVQIENHGSEGIPNAILFERRGLEVGYRIAGPVSEYAILAPPERNGTVEDLGRELEGILVAQGLYQDEAHAMVETWRDSWFEEGSRLIYIVPQSFVNGILPLSIHPTPVQTTRAFVGRMELVTPATEKAVERAFAAHDRATLEKYGRFLEPILQTMRAREANASHAQKLNEYLGRIYSAMMEQWRRTK